MTEQTLFDLSGGEGEVVFGIEDLNPREQEVFDKLVRRARRYLVAEAELLESIIEADQIKLYEKFGERFLTPYCVTYLKLSERVAEMFVSVARKSQLVPELKNAVDKGTLSVCKARTIVSVVTPENKEEWIDKAASLSKHNLEKEIARVSPSAIKKEKAKPVAENRNRIEFNLRDEYMDKERRAQDLVSQSLGTSASLEMTQEALLDFFLKHNDPVQKADRAQKRKKKVKRPSREGSKAQSKKPLKAEVVHAVHARDRGACQAFMADGRKCGSTRWVHIHHKVSRSSGGTDTLENLITLCSSHHRLWHKRDGW